MSLWVKLALAAIALLAALMLGYRLTHLSDPIIPTAALPQLVRAFTPAPATFGNLPTVAGVVPGVPPPSPPSIAIHGSQTTHVTITRFPVVSPSPGSTAGPSERIDIDVHQDGGATVPVSVPTPSLAPTIAVTTPLSIDEHSRLGIFAGTIPGLLAVDVQVVRLYPLAPLAKWKFVPPDLGRLEASLDAEINLKQAGLMVTTGGKVFGGVGGYGSWDMQAGWMGGIGMRF